MILCLMDALIVALTNRKLTTLNVEGCDLLTGHEFRMKFPSYSYQLLDKNLIDWGRKLVLDILTCEEVVIEKDRNKPLQENILNAINEALKATTTLKRLTGCLIYAKPFSAGEYSNQSFYRHFSLAEGLSANKSLIELDFSKRNDITQYACADLNDHERERLCRRDGFIESISRALKSVSLKKIDLSGNCLDCKDAAIIASALKANPPISELNLVNNKLTSSFEYDSYRGTGNKERPSYREVFELLKSLQSNTSLKELKIGSIYTNGASQEDDKQLVAYC